MNWKKRFVLLTSALLGVLFVCLVYAYKEYNRRPVELSTTNPDFKTDYDLILDEFLRDEQLANAKYTGKVISITGPIKNRQGNDDGPACFIELGDLDGTTVIRCSMDSAYCKVKVLPGSFIQVKGAYIGFNRDDLLGSDLVLNRCVITEQ